MISIAKIIRAVDISILILVLQYGPWLSSDKKVENYLDPNIDHAAKFLMPLKGLPPWVEKLSPFNVQTRAHMTTMLPARMIPTIFFRAGPSRKHYQEIRSGVFPTR